jgi:hypothetical protein
MRHGLGIMVYSNGRTYEGYWRDDKRHGKGYEKFSNGDIFIGHFHKGRIQGKGKRIWKQTGEVYEGEWFQGLRHGVGSWYVEMDKIDPKNHNQRIVLQSYTGNYMNNQFEGYGIFI